MENSLLSESQSCISIALLPIAASRTVNLGGTVATVGFPNIGLLGFTPGKVTGDV
jgi:hypothetical protein